MPLALLPLLDLVVVLVFAAVGRRSHGETDALTGIATTAWPFLVGALVGWAVVALAHRLPGRSLGAGVIVWLSTVVVGMLLRHLTDRGTAVSFIVVSLIFTGVCMLGWRFVANLLERRRA